MALRVRSKVLIIKKDEEIISKPIINFKNAFILDLYKKYTKKGILYKIEKAVIFMLEAVPRYKFDLY